MKLTLNRFAYSPMGTFGSFFIREHEFFTVERPWKGNRPNASCIPEGRYSLRLDRYNRGGHPAYEVVEVPGRSLIKIHRGNTMDDVSGCIAVGLGLGVVGGLWAVTHSSVAFRLFMEQAGGLDSLEIRGRIKSG